MAFKSAQQADLVLKKLYALPEVKLKHKNIPSRDSCQGGGQYTKTSGPTGNATENAAKEP